MADEGFLIEKMSANVALEELINESVDMADMDENLPLSGKEREKFCKRNSIYRENRPSLIKLKTNCESQPE